MGTVQSKHRLDMVQSKHRLEWCQEEKWMGSKKQSAPQRYHHGDLKRAIMTAALEMTEESGFASLSLREIARRIGVTTAAPYHHFKDRQSLLMELAIEGYSLLLLALQKGLNTLKTNCLKPKMEKLFTKN